MAKDEGSADSRVAAVFHDKRQFPTSNVKKTTATSTHFEHELIGSPPYSARATEPRAQGDSVRLVNGANKTIGGAGQLPSETYPFLSPKNSTTARRKAAGVESPEMTAVLGPKVRKNVLRTRGVGEGLAGYDTK